MDIKIVSNFHHMIEEKEAILKVVCLMLRWRSTREFGNLFFIGLNAAAIYDQSHESAWSEA
ncbi:hypothetical protein T4A_13526 [Trichinella pseudospiralis]|uniref:Uncharacterized protein n=1 Tax=Trichinella pseudospiralis TaxID=6337 RepID=A0A0V1E6W3_TRIPS|nr:hypothetical protein T4A_13526 [Trichinella pseudospiralis]KRZ36644.1 hypothetical protein T4C_12520 [Trichinella pseudospiralis]